MLKVTDVKKSFSSLILKGVSLNVEKGDVVSVIGPSGSGKTTLLRCMNYLERPDSGMMEFEGRTYDMHAVTKKQIAEIRKHTAFVFQNYNLFLNKTALQNVMEGLIIARKMDKHEAEAIAKKELDHVGLSDKYNSYPIQMSGGQQQRVAIARALAQSPDIIFFDEPTSALDPELISEVLNVMRNLADEGRTMIVVTHEMNFARNVSNRVIFMEDGRIIEEGPSKAFFEDPKEARTREFIRSISREAGDA